MKRIELTIKGKVQGVSYRAYCQEKARELGLTGWVQNNDDGTVTALAEGDVAELESLAQWAEQGSPTADVSDVESVWNDAKGCYEEFTIRF